MDPIVIREWESGTSRFWYSDADTGPVPAAFSERIKELESIFANAYAATRAQSKIPRIPSKFQGERYVMPNGNHVFVAASMYESHAWGHLADLHGEKCAQTVRVLGELAGRWAEEMAARQGKDLNAVALQERMAPQWAPYQRDWNLYVGWVARGALVAAPGGIAPTPLSRED